MIDVAKLLADLAERRDKAGERRDGTGLVLFATFAGLIVRIERGDYEEVDN